MGGGVTIKKREGGKGDRLKKKETSSFFFLGFIKIYDI
jgi:hypothetical protein